MGLALLALWSAARDQPMPLWIVWTLAITVVVVAVSPWRTALKLPSVTVRRAAISVAAAGLILTAFVLLA